MSRIDDWLLFGRHIRYFQTFRFFFFNDTATTEIYTLSLHDALPIWTRWRFMKIHRLKAALAKAQAQVAKTERAARSEEHTSELQSQSNLVCRLLLEKKTTYNTIASLRQS